MTSSSSAKTNINLQNRYDRIVVLIDMDCFYCQVEEKLNPDLEGKPIAVVQYNAWRGGGIIAVNYPARAQGVTRHMRGEDAQEHCPEINLVRVPNVREKADLTKYREAGKKVAEVLQSFTTLLERASIDEAYLDITEQVKLRLKEMNDGTFKIVPSSLENTYAVGYETLGLFIQEISINQFEGDVKLPEFYENETSEIDVSIFQKYNLNLLVGSSIVSEIRAKVKEKTGYECSAGIAHNKILAKLACGMNKPNKQTILSLKETPKLLKELPIHKIKGLGGKYGEDIVEELQVKTIGDLLKFSKSDLQKKYDEKNGSWLFFIARGIDLEAVTPRFNSKSIGCCKKFPGRNAITGLNTLNHWLNELANEIADRLDKDIIENNRKAKQMVVSYIQEINANDVSSSRSSPLPSYDVNVIAKSALEILQKNTTQFFKPDNSKSLNNPIKFLGISVGKFENISAGQSTLQEMFSKQKQKTNDVESVLNNENESCSTTINSNNNTDLLNVEENTEDNSVMVQNTEPKTKNLKNESVLKSFFKSHFNKNKSTAETSNDSLTDSQKAANDSSLNSSVQHEIHKDENSNNAPTPSSSNLAHSNYTETYAEYTLIPQTDDFVTCEECGKNILSFNFQTHLDGHIAFKLSQQLREEYRNEIKVQSQSQKKSSNANKKSSPLNKSISTKTNTAKKKKEPPSPAGNITKYLKTCDKPAISDMKDYVKCGECGCFVLDFKIQEHKDLHLAQKIQREWN